VQTPDGFLYGMTYSGGPTTLGTLFRVSLDGKFKVVHVFENADGRNPQGGLVLGVDGNLYGTTSVGGAHGFGTIFRMSTANGDYRVLRSFGAKGKHGFAAEGLVANPDGTFYGTTCGGGVNGSGNVYKLTPKP